jgi:hypothetical protein
MGNGHVVEELDLVRLDIQSHVKREDLLLVPAVPEKTTKLVNWRNSSTYSFVLNVAVRARVHRQ